ncbi:hypothetical protein [Variovorax sp.]|uniref:hypothetical protein n=1 Tax=Variovorax sp. TaxID=1871043 RepID=UPI0037DA1985
MTRAKHLEIGLAAVAAIATLVPLALWAVHVGKPTFSAKASDWADFGTYVGGVLSPLLAFAGYIGLLFTIRQQREAAWKQQEDRDGKDYFNHAVSCLERAFATISANGESRTPVNERLAWLTCARLLLSAQAAANLIAKESTGLRTLYEGESEHWRRQFYELFRPTSPDSFGNEAVYFLVDRGTPSQPIDERSTRVIYDFISWPPEKEDPIDQVERYSDEEIDKMRRTVGKLGLARALMSWRGTTRG